MAARQGALAAGAARASGERAKRRSTPLIGADPVVLADDTPGPDDASAPTAGASSTTKPAKKKAARSKAVSPKAGGTRTKKKAAPTTPAATAPADPPVGEPTASEKVASGAGSTRPPHRPEPQVRSAPSRSATSAVLRTLGSGRGR